ncbi:hypothetical protein JAAARDRAFT_55397 [Jaapia argillacea MUCL 33604]|uniref:Alpha-ketoglutarate-dependent dioxygenase AlkB-like domain-containing protein n=1 Tax=Jaapia argillacea MUCL 33604 TaxID=933084 RepID=A0A067Q117_9AGAM|nr:hypothetical protein JAAARDRAFT_55397 [Jaapia argillacea MUCL 33604]
MNIARLQYRFMHRVARRPDSKFFSFIPSYFNLAEQRILLQVSLQKLNSMEGRLLRKRRKVFEASRVPVVAPVSIEDIFLPDEYYQFEEGHFDGVIKNYREMHITSWPEAEVEGLSPILNRLKALYPSTDTQTHLLHLASDGEILPHVDNLSASGSWIMGVSLGAERILRLEQVASDSNHVDIFEMPLPSGSVYIQKDFLRYHHQHAILKSGLIDGRMIGGGQRLSILIRDRLPPEGSKIPDL